MMLLDLLDMFCFDIGRCLCMYLLFFILYFLLWFCVFIGSKFLCVLFLLFIYLFIMFGVWCVFSVGSDFIFFSLFFKMFIIEFWWFKCFFNFFFFLGFFLLYFFVLGSFWLFIVFLVRDFKWLNFIGVRDNLGINDVGMMMGFFWLEL